MTGAPQQGKLYQLFTKAGPCSSGRTHIPAGFRRDRMMAAGLAIVMFIALFGFGQNYFGWSDPSGKVQLALFTSFILGIIASYKSRG